MKKDDNKKRWYYDLTEKQVCKIIAVVEIVVFIITSCRIATWPIWTNEELLEQVLEKNGMDMVTLVLFTIAILFCAMGALGMLIWELLWENIQKQVYLFLKEHDEKIVPRVREKFRLSSDFREVVPKLTDQKSQYFAKETEDGILIIQKDKTGNELKSELIGNYNYFDLNYEPKIM